MERIRQLLSEILPSIPPEWYPEIGGGLIVAAVLGTIVFFKDAVRALFMRLAGGAPTPQPLPPQQVEVKVIAQPPPQPEPAAVETTPPAPFIPPPPAVGFVTRRNEEGRDILEILKDALAPTSSQLVALWGGGGYGKTTLATEAARALKEDFKNRILWVSAEKHADFTFSTLLDEIAQKSGRNDLLRLAPEPKKAEVQTLLAAAPTLVVLDNFETVSPDEQRLCAEFLSQGYPFPALITTREKVPGAKNISLERMTPAEADELLERLIAEADIAQALAGLDHNTVLQAADWNPLVMEWVVAQMMSDQPRVVLDDLAHGEGDAARRVFDRSFNLRQLGDDGRDALLALSLFVPSATREALAAVAAFGDGAKRPREAARILTALRLIRMTAGNERLFIAGLTRQLAQVRLARDPRAAEFRQRFVAYFLRHAEAHAQPTPGDLDALEAEKDNLLNAMDMASGAEDYQSLMTLRCALDSFLDLRGYWDEAIQRAEHAVRAARAAGCVLAGARFSASSAKILVRRGEYGDARRRYEELLLEFKALGSDVDVAGTLHQLGVVAHYQGELLKARRLYEAGLEIDRRINNRGGIARDLHQLGRLVQGQKGGLAEAKRLYEESLRISRELGDLSDTASTLRQLGRVAQKLGDLDEARRLYDESLRIRERLGEQSGIASVTSQIGILLIELGRIGEARGYLEKSRDIRRSIKNQQGVAIDSHWLGVIARRQGDLTGARRLYDESLEIAKRLGNQSGIATSLHQLGRLAEDEGDRAEAARLFAEALDIFEKLDSSNADMARQSLERVGASLPEV